MTARERLDQYLNSLRRRLRMHIYVRAFAACAGAVALTAGAAVWLMEREEFAPAVTLSGRIAIAIALLAIAVLLLWKPLTRLRRDDGAQIFEERMPAQGGRVQTYLDARRAVGVAAESPLIELLADDAAAIAERTPVRSMVSSARLGAGLAIGGAAILLLTWMLSMGPAHWGFGARHLLLGADLPRDAVPVRRVTVAPGDAIVRRNSDLAIRASVDGFHPQDAQLFVRFADQTVWERAPMQIAAEDRSRFEFKLYAVRGPLSYYVDAEGTRSPEHSVSVVDLPKIERVRLTYSYPEWTGLAPAVDEEVRDIRAVAGTSVQVEVFADAPLEAPALIIDGATRELSPQEQASVGAIDVQKPGRYQIGARVANEFVPLSDEYAIDVVPDEKPTVAIRKPGRDWRATSIEEVPVRIRAQDDFRLRDVQLRYSVNGGEWRSVAMGAGVRESDSESLLRLEELGAGEKNVESRLVPGDLVSYYAVARDRRYTAESDLFMVQVQPFERSFRQAQSGGGAGGGMGDEQGAISERQREILLATWNLQRNDERNARTREQLRDSANMLADLQATLAQQARTLAERTRARATLDDARIQTFVDSLDRAAAMMDPAAKNLNEFKLAEAVPAEQQALQQLLRAEAAFREVQVSMQQDNQGGGMQNSRTFTEMFELEMDLEKNQYESESQLSMQNAQRDMDEAIRKLKELAERQEKLAQEANRTLRVQEQRWRQEQLRREAEDLRRRLAELNAQQQQGSPSDDPSRSNSQGQTSGQSSTDPGDAQRGAELAQALDSINRALESMQAANEDAGRDQTQADEAARQAGQNLRRALKRMDQPATSGLDQELEQLAERAQELREEQRRIESDLYSALSRTGSSDQITSRDGGLDRRKAQELVQSKQQMAADLTALQGDMRSAVHEHRTREPEATRRVSEIIRELEGSDVMYRVNRSAAEIYYGRAREAALREGLIAEALETLERDLREASALAARDGEQKTGTSDPERLLAEVAEMRRALQAGRSQPEDPALQAGRSQPENPAPQAEQGAGASGEVDATRGSPRNLPREARLGWGSLARETAELGQRVRDTAIRMHRGELTQAEFDALRRRANELRRLAGDPLSGHEAMLELIDQIELAALAAAPQSNDAAAARATLPSPDSPRYREAVAEYYRRLGSK
jgi:hypothetical protein